MLSLREENKILSFHFSIFHSKFYKRHGTCFDRIVGGRCYLTKANVRWEEDTCKTNMDQEGERRLIFEVSSKLTF